MKRLIDALANTTEPITIIIEGLGFSFTFTSTIITIEDYIDGIELHLQDENNFFISTIGNELMDVDPDGDSTQFILKSLSNEIIRILIAN